MQRSVFCEFRSIAAPTTLAIDYHTQICAPRGRKSYLLRKKMVQERKKKLT